MSQSSDERLREFSPEIQSGIRKWLSDAFDEATRLEIAQLLATDPRELGDAFDGRLTFGTGGMRGLVGAGTRRMNRHTVSWATQGIAQFLRQKYPGEAPRVAIGWDSRITSREFALTAARVLAGNGVCTLLFGECCPTPLLSFACRHHACRAGLMITASHNPANYNGYKVYGEDGSQVVSPDDGQISELVGQIDQPSQVRLAPASAGNIQAIPEETIEAYFAAIDATNPDPEMSARAARAGCELKIAYTPLHGAGSRFTPRALSQWGFQRLVLVERQMAPDGRFPTVVSPNPEDASALTLGIEALDAESCDLLIANDPDSDRMGVVVRETSGHQILTGNEIAALILHHLCTAFKERDQLPTSGALIKSLVTSDFSKAIAEAFGLRTFDVPPGFKYIAALQRRWREARAPWTFFFGAEESLGYLFGDYAKDKDGVQAACLIGQCALRAKLYGKSLGELLQQLYAEYGVFRERHLNLAVSSGRAGAEKVAAISRGLRESPPATLAGQRLRVVADPLPDSEFAPADMLVWELGEGGKLVVRPSGTEPKIKVYLFARFAKSDRPIDEQLNLADRQLEQMLGELSAAIRVY